MQNKLLPQGDPYTQKHRRRKIWQRIVGSMACVVVFVTTYMLILPAITLEQTAYCGLEEHHHSAECWETQLVCELDTETSHTHTEECYEEQEVLVCDLEESDGHVHDESCVEVEETLVCEEDHDHTDECYETTETYICGMEEGEGAHTHGPECYDTEKTLICDIPEGVHEHTKKCYDEVLVCGLKEHEHSLACYSDPDADVEDSDDWEDSVSEVKLTKVWADDLAAVAESQLDYEESTRNYSVTEDDEIKGYSRYGAWYGEPYADWDAMFVSFCLNYAGIPEDAMPYDFDCEHWIEQLSKAKYDCFYDADSYDPVKGDLIFFDLDEDDTVDHVGIIAEISEDEENGTHQIKTIEGDVEDCVRSCDYEPDDPMILGYGKLPEYSEEFESNHGHGGSGTADDGYDGTFELTASTVNGISLCLTGAEDSLPYPADEIRVTVDVVINESAAALVDAAVADTELANGQLYLFDVRLWHGDEEIEPTGPVVLTFEGAITSAETDTASVFHVDEDAEQATDMNAALTEDGSVVVDTNHFSLYALMVLSDAGGNVIISQNMTASWDAETNSISKLIFTVSSTTDKMYFRVETSDNDGTTWTTSGTESAKTDKNTQVELDGTAALTNAPLNRLYRVYGYKDNNNTGYTASVTLYDILDSVKSGFSDWLNQSYVQDFGGTALPAATAELYDAFAVYYALPELTIASRMDGDTMYVDAKPSKDGTYTYKWEYRDENDNWVELCPDTTDSFINASGISVLLNGGKEIRCKIYDGEQIKATSNTLLVNPLRQLYDEAIAAINSGLNLGTLAINGTKFKDYFYYGNVAKDSRVPFSDAQSYADYLAKLYLDSGSGETGLAAVQAAWNKYLYDLYDPSLDNGKKSNMNGGYPGNGSTYGDQNLGWPKDSASSFHGTLAPTIEDLSYDFLEDGVDYSNFVSSLGKTATAVAAGDANTDRKYNIDITANTQAKARGPVAMILQIQTSWQMFDMKHANAPKEGDTEVGAVAKNTELATLYDIKQALLRFVDYMEVNYPGNNLVLGITEVQHAGSQTMFSGGDTKNPLYVTNNYDILRDSIRAWDSFGNCEHVHYDTNALKAATSALQNNLAGWTDVNDEKIEYNDIQKVAVIIGGPTENSSSTNGYGCTLPWDTFQTAGLNSVYSIRTNEGTPLNDDNVISWLDYSKNNTGDPFNNGAGTTFTSKYVATTEDAVFHYLVQIAEQEMKKKGIDTSAEGAYVDDVTVTDTISDEFALDTSAPITATVYNKDGTVDTQITVSQDDPNLSIKKNTDGTTTITYNFGTVYNTKKCVLHFGIQANEEYIGSNNVYSNVGTPEATYSHEKASGIVQYSTTSFDTPEVNVPIRFDTTDGDEVTILVGDKTDLADLSDDIVKDAESRIKRYDQINGTLSYTWVRPDGTTVDAGSVTVVNGSIGEQNLPSRTYTFEGTEEGQYVYTLKVTFTPTAVDTSSRNFSDDTTAEAVNALAKDGKVWINVVDSSSTQRFIVRKEWIGDPPSGTDSIRFRVLANGTVVTDDSGQPLEYELNAGNDWETEVRDLPSVKDGVIQEYTVEEIDCPAGYLATYRTETRQENDWAAKVVLSFTPKAKVGNKALTITCKYNGQEYTCQTPKQDYEKDEIYDFTVDNLPLNENGEPYSCEFVSLVKTDDGKEVETTLSSAAAEKYLRGTTAVEVKVITNTPAYALPSTGGMGTAPNILGGLLLMLSAAALLLYTSLRRRKEDV